MNRFVLMSYILKKHMMPIYVRSLQTSLKRRKLKDGQYNEQYNKRHEKAVVHRTMHKMQKMQQNKYQYHWKPKMTAFPNFDSTLAICLTLFFIELLDNCITYSMCWYNTLHQILPVAWKYHITNRRFRDLLRCWFTQQNQWTSPSS